MPITSFDPERLARLDRRLARYVDEDLLAGWQLAVAKDGEVAHEALYGWRDREARLPVTPDTVWRIASMTKPVISVAAMALWEQGVFELTDPISRWIPAFEEARVYVRGYGPTLVTVPAAEPVRVWHLLSHTSGLTAGFLRNSVVDTMYRDAGYEFAAPPHPSVAECVDDWARLPLLFQPGSAWGYGVSHDVLGRLIEIWAGERLDAAVARLVLEPLKMNDTVWWCDESRADRLAALYYRGASGTAELVPAGELAKKPPAILSGGGGLLSTVSDYLRFTQMLLGDGELDGVRVLAPRTIRLMTRNHLPGDLASVTTGGFAETSFEGIGFGLGFAVLLDPAPTHTIASAGEFYWGGLYSTMFWVDPREALSCVFMTQLMPSSTYPIRSQIRQLLYSALV